MAGFKVARLEAKPLGTGGVKQIVGQLLLSVPIIGEYATSYIITELVI